MNKKSSIQFLLVTSIPGNTLLEDGEGAVSAIPRAELLTSPRISYLIEVYKVLTPTRSFFAF